ncbi:MAG: histone deacetylase [Candidatus Hodarchaeota archaeon]
MMGTDLLFHETFTRHVISPGHPERPERLSTAIRYISNSGLLEAGKVNVVEPQKAQLDDIMPLHSEAYLQGIRRKSEMGGGFFTLDTAVNQFSYDAAVLAAGAGVMAADRIMEGKSDNAYVLCRPPGHHAEYERAFGFCFINNIAVSAQRLIKKHDLDRVLIVDYDAHHGNGTQNAFYSSNQVLYVGLHQDGRTLFPGSGFPNEIGSGKGKGYNVNLAMYPGAGDLSFDLAFSEIIERIGEQFEPEFILVSAGFDGHFQDPLTNLGLTTSGIAMLNSRLNTLAMQYCDGRIAFFLEGGYDLDTVGRGSLNIVEELSGSQTTKYGDMHRESENCIEYTRALIKKLIDILDGTLF